MPSPDPSALLTVAEIAIALAGFSAVVVIFKRRSSGEWARADADRFHGMVLHAMAATAFAFLPFVVALFTDVAARVWSISSGLLGVQILWHVSVVVRLPSSSPGTRPFMLLGVAAAALQGLNAFGIAFDREFAPYLVGVLWHVVQSGVLFVWLIWIPESDVEAG